MQSRFLDYVTRHRLAGRVDTIGEHAVFGDVVPLAAGIFLDVLNLALFVLQLGGDTDE